MTIPGMTKVSISPRARRRSTSRICGSKAQFKPRRCVCLLRRSHRHCRREAAFELPAASCRRLAEQIDSFKVPSMRGTALAAEPALADFVRSRGRDDLLSALKSRPSPDTRSRWWEAGTYNRGDKGGLLAGASGVVTLTAACEADRRPCCGRLKHGRRSLIGPAGPLSWLGWVGFGCRGTTRI